MQSLSPNGQQLVRQLAQRFGLSEETVVCMLVAVNNGGGTMAQFSCPELGGSGQWMRGGMTMVGDMFNHSLKALVDNLCSELAIALANEQIFVPVAMTPSRGGRDGSQGWWPGDLGPPFSTGSQNHVRYAVFPGRLAVESHGRVTVYDTLDHNIAGISQQQGSDSTLTFSSQYGTVPVSSLPVLHSGQGAASQENFAQELQGLDSERTNGASSAMTQRAQAKAGDAQRGSLGGEVLALIQQLAELRDSGVLTEDEFSSKKRELLQRL